MTGIERIPPQAVDVEQAVLGAMMIDVRAIEGARDILQPEDFYYAPHAPIYQVIVDLYDHRISVDQLTVAEALRKGDKLDQVGGVVYLAKLAAEVATWANVIYHARIVKAKAMMRRIIALGGSMAASAYEDAEDPITLVQRAEDDLLNLLHGNQTGGLESVEVALTEALVLIEKAHQCKGTLTGIPTGLNSLNRLTGGWQTGDLILLAARPSVGKTALALDMVRAAMDSRKKVAFFSLEMARHQLVQRLIAQAKGFDLHSLRTGQLEEAEWVSLAHAVGRLSQQPLWIDDRSGLTVFDINSQCRRLQREHGLDLVFIDYLQLMDSTRSTTSREQEVAQISRGIKGLAKELRIPVVALSQLSRALETRVDRRPKLSDLRESGSLEQDADIVMFLYRPDIYGITSIEIGSVPVPSTGMVELTVAKQRNGPVGALWLKFEDKQTTFLEYTLAPAWRVESMHPDNA